MSNKNKIKFMILLIMITMLFYGMSFVTSAAEETGYEVVLSDDVTEIGKEVVLTVALTNYTSQSDPIRGLQIDIENVDADVLSVVSYNSLITDSSAISNTASYSSNNSRIRLVYANFSGTLPVSDGSSGKMNVFEVKFKINSTLAIDGQVELPVTVKLQTVSSQITLSNSVIIGYTATHSHVLGEEADCENDQICIDCGEIVIPKLGHEYATELIPPSCSAGGYTKHDCIRCDSYYEDSYTDKQEHTPSEWIIDKEPGVGVEGEKHTYCTECGLIIEISKIDPIENETDEPGSEGSDGGSSDVEIGTGGDEGNSNTGNNEDDTDGGSNDGNESDSSVSDNDNSSDNSAEESDSIILIVCVSLIAAASLVVIALLIKRKLG